MAAFIPVVNMQFKNVKLMTFDQLKEKFSAFGCHSLFAKELAPNDNSKNQIFLGCSFDVLNQIPVRNIVRDSSSVASSRRDRFKAEIDFYWLGEDRSSTVLAPCANLILYPKYPEVRLSGLIKGCSLDGARKKLYTSREVGRVLIFGIVGRKVYSTILGPNANSRDEIVSELRSQEQQSVLVEIPIGSSLDENESVLLRNLTGIYERGWIKSYRLDRDGNRLECKSPNCGGYTLEAELGVVPNALAEPDFEGWEVKTISMPNATSVWNSKPVTLMTPEPDLGVYCDAGVETFIRSYGYPDRKGRPDRLNFGGVFRINKQHKLTSLTLNVEGWNFENNCFFGSDGSICLNRGDEYDPAAGWSLSKLLEHWNQKHARAVYIPNQVRKSPEHSYRFGPRILLCQGTGFDLLMNSLHKGEVYLDPALKLEYASSKNPKSKRRNQIRISSKDISKLYRKAFR